MTEVFTFARKPADDIRQAVDYVKSLPNRRERADYGTQVDEDPDDGFFAIPGVATLMTGQNAKWDYPLVEIDDTQWQPDGSPVPLAGGRVVNGRNDVECQNPASGVGTMGSGNGISTEEFDGGIMEQPIPPLGVVKVRQTTDCNGLIVYRFAAWNKKGDCPT